MCLNCGVRFGTSTGKLVAFFNQPFSKRFVPQSGRQGRRREIDRKNSRTEEKQREK